MRHLLIALSLMLASGVSLAADFNAGMAAYDRQDYRTAAEEFGALAEAGDYHAQYMLGRMYAQGKGVAQDKVQAHKWYNIAASRGHTHAAEARDDLAQEMRWPRIAEARQLARQWRPGAATPAVQPMSYQELSAAIQQGLNTLGYDPGPADGVMGGRTRAAIRDYQKDQGVPIDGQPSQELLRHLEESLRAAGVETSAPAYATGTSKWQRLLLRDSFADGDYTRNPAWTVSAGRFSVESGAGLRTVHVPREPVAETRSEDLPLAILSAILGQSSRPGDGETTEDAPDYAEIHVDQFISNAFAIQLALTMNQEATGTLAFGPYQANNRVSGYRLVYTPNVERGLHLVRITSTGSSVTESVDAQLRPNQQYLVQWTRDLNGEMTVSIDRKAVLRVTDRSYANPFNGFTLVNRGGDYALQEITIHGVE
ncbi:MAG TPA: SEL1-like repeat protein [Xanthomonadales bacterium]|nr:SEL1-like repeat protein [Xanthomonadales bacterium]